MPILDHRGNPIEPTPPAPAARVDPVRPKRSDVRAKYDSAQTTDENRRHWANADNLSARAANSPAVRQTLRDRSRYEVANNSYAGGIVDTLAVDTIGTGPLYQALSPDKGLNAEIEAAWAEWSLRVDFAQKLRTAVRAETVDGESFSLITQPNDPSLPVNIDIDVREAEECRTPYGILPNRYECDGIRFDENWKPREYVFTRSFPGDDHFGSMALEYDAIPARYVMHLFRPTRPRQLRGIPELTAVLPLFALLRRYTLAVIKAAEIAAAHAGVLQSDLPPDTGDGPPQDEGVPAGEGFVIEHGMMVAIPPGQKLEQFDAKQPMGVYGDFKREILKEIARILAVPYNVAAGDSSGYNYSSGRLDQQTFYRRVEVNRSRIQVKIIDPVNAEWLVRSPFRMQVARLTPLGQTFPHRWLWPGFAYVDPKQEAEAAVIMMGSFLTTFSDECRARGKDPEAVVATIAGERKLFDQYGIKSPYPLLAAESQGSDQPTDGGNSDEDASQEDPASQSGDPGVDAGAGVAVGDGHHRNGRSFAR